MALRGTIVVCMDKIYPSTRKKREGTVGKGWCEVTDRFGSNRDGCQATRAVRGRRGIVPSSLWQVPSGATAVLLPFLSFASLHYILCVFWLSRAPFSHPLPSFLPLHPPVARLIPRAGSNPLLFVSRWPPSIPTVLCSLTLPVTKPLSRRRHSD